MAVVSSPELLVKGTCHHDCPDSCGWVASVSDGTVTQLRGNPDHPFSQGELCPKVNRFVDRVYAPDRLTTPLLRVGPKGAGEFRPASWDEALGVVRDRLTELIAAHGGEAVLPWWDAGTQGLIQMSSLDRPFFAGLGATRLVGSLCGATARHGFTVTCGSGRSAQPTDVEHSDLVLLWATNTRLTNRHLWPFVERARARGAEVVVIDAFRTVTAESADRFIQPLPGTDLALILAMIHVIVHDDLVDHAYVADHTTGYGELVAAAADWPAERAAAVCGLDAAEIEWLARAYATTQPAMIRTLIGAEHHGQGAMFFRALACLPAITGSWRHLGGGLSRSVGAWTAESVDDSVFDAPSSARSVNMNHLGRVLCDEAMGIHALFVWCGNPVVSVPNAAAVRRGLEREDLFCVVSEQFMTDTARFADVVFPATTQLEHLDLVESWGHLELGWNEPAIAPVGDAVPNTELWRRLAAVMGVEDPRFALSDEELVRSALLDVDVERLRRDGFVRVNAPDEILPYAHGGFGHPDGRARLGSPPGREPGLGLEDGPPHFEVDRVTPDPTRPLVLLTPKMHTRFLNSSYSHHHGERETPPHVEIHPDDAADRGIAEGDEVEVVGEHAALSFAAHLSGRVRPGVVAVAWGWWGADRNVNALTTDELTDGGGGVAFSDTRVEVRPTRRGDGSGRLGP